MAVNVDLVLESVGEFGPYQRRIYFLLCLPIIFVGAINFSYVFIVAEPLYRCIIKGCDNETSPIYSEPFLNFTTPFNEKSKEYEGCRHYERRSNLTTCENEDFINETETCDDGIVFDKSIYKSTIVTEFGLICDDGWEANAAQSIYFGGILAGSFIFGFLSDLIGRRKTILIAIGGMATSGVCVALIPNLISFHILRFLNAFFSSGVFQTAFILGLEFVGPSKRVMFGVIGEYFFSFGEILLGLLAWAIPSWRMLQLVISAPVTCFLFYYWVVPESVRWLQAKGQHAKVISSLEEIAKANNTNVPLHLLRHQAEEVAEEPEGTEDLARKRKVTILDILSSFHMAMRLFFLVLLWIITTLVYYGLSYSAVKLSVEEGPSAPYVNFILSSIVEIPGYTMAWWGMVYWGRKGSLVLSLLMAGSSCIGTGLLEGKDDVYVLVAFLLGKCSITSAFAIIYVFTAELFPTSVRNTILGICSMFARIGGMAAPFSTSLKSVYSALPMLTFGAISVLGAMVTVFMPESINTTLPETISDALNLGRSQGILPVSPPRIDVQQDEEEEALLDNGDDDDVIT